MDERVEPMPEAPEGECLMMGDRGVWAVRGRTAWFRCNAHTMYCECSSFLVQTRRGIALTPCEHLRALARHLASVGEEEECLIVGALPTDAELRRLFS